MGRGEIVALLGALALMTSLFVAWFATNGDNPNSTINGGRGDFSAWITFPILRWLLLAACVAPVILTLLVITGQQVSWDRGEITAIVGVTAVVLILYNGFLGGPSQQNVGITLAGGWYLALVAAAAIFLGGALRMIAGGVRAKPPGV